MPTSPSPTPAPDGPARTSRRAGGKRPALRRFARLWLVGAVVIAGVATLAGCNVETGLGSWSRLGLPPAASDRAPYMLHLWIGFWITAAVVGALVWGLIIFAIIRYRKRDERAPRQIRYNLPIEILYTAAPFIIVFVLFAYTIHGQNAINEKVDPAVTVDVVGWKWSWTFNYPDADVYETGTPEHFPDLYLPVDEPVLFNLSSSDVIHSFWVPAFYFKMDVVPGRHNSFTMTPTKVGEFAGKCAELCGAGHSQMLFTVHIVTRAQFDQEMARLRSIGQTGQAPAPKAPTLVLGTGADKGEEPR